VKKLCSDCRDWKTIYPEYDFRHESLYYYNDFAGEILKKYKIAGDCELSLLFAGQLQECFRHFPQNSLIIPIPVSAASHLKRGFNQVEILLENAGIRFSSSLENVGRGEKQSKKNREERMRTAQPFWVKPDFEGQIHGRPVVLVDDLYTTGRTLFHAVDALKALSPSSVQSFSLFR